MKGTCTGPWLLIRYPCHKVWCSDCSHRIWSVWTISKKKGAGYIMPTFLWVKNTLYPMSCWVEEVKIHKTYLQDWWQVLIKSPNTLFQKKKWSVEGFIQAINCLQHGLCLKCKMLEIWWAVAEARGDQMAGKEMRMMLFSWIMLPNCFRCFHPFCFQK